MEKSTIAHETINQETNNQEDNMTETNKPETINQTATNPNKEDNMTASNTEKTNTANIDIEKLKDLHSAIKKDYVGLSENEKSSAVKSYNMGHNLNLLHEDGQYRNLPDNNGNQFKTWQSFCEEGCGFTRAYADKLMKIAAIQDELEETGATTVKQSVANLYALHNAKKGNPDLNLAEVWKKATENNPEAFPTRKDVLSAINPGSHTPKRTTKVANDLPSLLSAIKAFTLSDEDKQQVRQVLDELLNGGRANPIHEDSPETIITAEPVKLSA